MMIKEIRAKVKGKGPTNRGMRTEKGKETEIMEREKMGKTGMDQGGINISTNTDTVKVH
jgi:hypothetical protein